MLKQRLLTTLAAGLHAGIVFILSTTGAQALTTHDVVVMLSDDSKHCLQLGKNIPTTGGGATTLWQDDTRVYMAPCVYDRSTGNPFWTQEFRISYFNHNTFYIKTDNPGKCLEVEDGSTEDFARIQQKTCNGGPHQRWTMERIGDNYGAGQRIRNVHSNKCLSGVGPMYQRTCGSSPFFVLPTGKDLRITSAWSGAGKCLDVHNVGIVDGAKIQQWDCLSYHQNNQKWKLEIVRFPTSVECCYATGDYDAAYVLRPMHTLNDNDNMLIRPSPYPPQNGTPVTQRFDHNNPAEWWVLYPEYYYGLRFRLEGWSYGLCLDQDNAKGNVNGAKVQTWQCNGWSNQAWYIRRLTP